jgi:hypothetical protein
VAWDWEKANVATQEYILGDVADQVFGSNVFLNRMRARGRKHKGGSMLTKKVNLGKNTNFKWYTGHDVFNKDPMETLGEAKWDWVQAGGTINISGRDEAINSGSPEAFFDLIKQERDVAVGSLEEQITGGIFSDGTGAGPDMTGIIAAIDDGTNYPIYGDITVATYTDWKANRFANGGVDRAITYKLIRRARSSTLYKGKKATMGLAAVDIMDKITELLQPHQQLSDQSEASLGFDNIIVERVCPVYVDEECTVDTLFFIQERDMYLVTHTNRDFVFEPFMKSEDQDAMVAKLLWMGQLCCERRKTHAMLTDIDADL